MRTLIGYLTVAALAAAAYLGVMFVPVYLDNLNARDIVNTSFNQYRDLRSLEALAETVLRQFNAVPWATHVVEDKNGEKQVVKGLGLTEDNLFINFNEETRTLTLRVTYSRTVQLKPTDKVRKVNFVVERVGQPPDYSS